MSATIIDGTAIGNRIKQEIAAQTARLASEGKRVHLTAVIVGSTPAAEVYANRQGEACRAVGIDYTLQTLPDDISQRQLRDEIRKLNKDKSVTGIMLHAPVPPHIDLARMQFEIDVTKDVEGVNPANIGYVVYGHTLIAPCTAGAVVELIHSTGIDLYGKEAVIVGASEIAGKPIALLLLGEGATPTLCHIGTRDLISHTRRADILVVAVGKPGLIGAAHVRAGAIVIDVGINRVKQPDGTSKTVGDVQFDAVQPIASHLTPVPGGVGPMTVAMLLKNTLRAAEIVLGK
ncbi:MAG TPA: bifunctional 5,10-methylenetetrahydrofolate dehydrogenase/5,10-methenyltetrahydrofolate cyclohydrolase [Tepidisphaeraceae bacterium]|nr:bifunctional 5,10-methylenetetrahydrofolate dehydrogenase/5,10-methenyltetrahydrofolate cyclohydrolase [Tepidisphaeraceae bacterium]